MEKPVYLTTNKGKFEEAIKNDWRKTGDWQPGWDMKYKKGK